ncbi:TetR/AcrR family transcriptional regulator [Micromonospora sp. NPDC049559]|uniref:TetR/AcrR family transcriptional regulator n=1 Tax=Micromonospora sp. NPDC049559 TaxID=3155923 RepID=UPI0034472473
MPSITRRPARPDRRASVEAQVLATTGRLLREGTPFTELGVQRIAAEAGVARSTFYSHFRDKTDLLLRLAGTMQRTALDIGVSWRPETGPEGLAEVFLQVVRVYREYEPVLTAINEVAAYDRTVREFWVRGLRPFTENSNSLLRREQEAGRIPADLDIDHASRVIVVGGERAIADHVAASGGDESQDEAFARELALIWWHGAYHRPRT